jgi:hypothetical protein
VSESLPFHPSCAEFDLMEGAEFEELVGDIKRRGLHVPIITHEGKIIDGRNRARACAEAGETPRYVEFDGGADDVARFIISMNIHRRHLKPERRRELLVRLLKIHPEKSDRVIAAEIGVNQSTVSRARKSTDAPASVDGKRIGRDGRARSMPTKNPKTDGSAVPATSTETIPPVTPAKKAEAPSARELQARALQDVGPGSSAEADLKRIRLEELQSKIHQLEMANRGLQDEIKDLRDEIAALQKENDKLRAAAMKAAPTLDTEPKAAAATKALAAPDTEPKRKLDLLVVNWTDENGEPTQPPKSITDANELAWRQVSETDFDAEVPSTGDHYLIGPSHTVGGKVRSYQVKRVLAKRDAWGSVRFGNCGRETPSSHVFVNLVVGLLITAAVGLWMVGARLPTTNRSVMPRWHRSTAFWNGGVTGSSAPRWPPPFSACRCSQACASTSIRSICARRTPNRWRRCWT